MRTHVWTRADSQRHNPCTQQTHRGTATQTSTPTLRHRHTQAWLTMVSHHEGSSQAKPWGLSWDDSRLPAGSSLNQPGGAAHQNDSRTPTLHATASKCGNEFVLIKGSACEKKNADFKVTTTRQMLINRLCFMRDNVGGSRSSTSYIILAFCSNRSVNITLELLLKHSLCKVTQRSSFKSLNRKKNLNKTTVIKTTIITQINEFLKVVSIGWIRSFSQVLKMFHCKCKFLLSCNLDNLESILYSVGFKTKSQCFHKLTDCVMNKSSCTYSVLGFDEGKLMRQNTLRRHPITFWLTPEQHVSSGSV